MTAHNRLPCRCLPRFGCRFPPAAPGSAALTILPGRRYGFVLSEGILRFWACKKRERTAVLSRLDTRWVLGGRMSDAGGCEPVVVAGSDRCRYAAIQSRSGAGRRSRKALLKLMLIAAAASCLQGAAAGASEPPPSISLLSSSSSSSSSPSSESWLRSISSFGEEVVRGANGVLANFLWGLFGGENGASGENGSSRKIDSSSQSHKRGERHNVNRPGDVEDERNNLEKFPKVVVDKRKRSTDIVTDLDRYRNVANETDETNLGKVVLFAEDERHVEDKKEDEESKQGNKKEDEESKHGKNGKKKKEEDESDGEEEADAESYQWRVAGNRGVVIAVLLLFALTTCLTVQQTAKIIEANAARSRNPVATASSSQLPASSSAGGSRNRRTLLMILLSAANIARLSSLALLAAFCHQASDLNFARAAPRNVPVEWYMFLAESLPSLLFLSSFSIIILFWAQLYYAAILYSLPLLRPAIAFLNVFLYVSYISVGFLTFTVGTFDEFRFWASPVIEILFIVAAISFANFGIKVARQLHQSKPLAGKESLIYWVVVLAACCPLLLLPRIIYFTGRMVGLFRPFCPPSFTRLSWDSLIALISEGAPSLLIVVAFYSRKSPDNNGQIDNRSSPSFTGLRAPLVQYNYLSPPPLLAAGTSYGPTAGLPPGLSSRGIVASQISQYHHLQNQAQTGGVPGSMHGGMPGGMHGGMPGGMHGGMPGGMHGGMPGSFRGHVAHDLAGQRSDDVFRDSRSSSPERGPPFVGDAIASGRRFEHNRK